MGDLQPGVGYNVLQSPMGDALEILFPAQPEQIVQQFQTEIVTPGATATIRVANGTAFLAGKGQSVGGEGMKEWAIKTFSVFPTGKRTTGSDTGSKWASQGGTVEISNASVEGGSDTWYVYLVANNYDNSAADSAYPMLAVIAAGSDAYTKSRPFLVDDDIRWFQPYSEVTSATVTQPDDTTVTGYLVNNTGLLLLNYNCQRMTLAKLVWTTDRWVVTQYAYGPVTFTSDVRIAPSALYADGDPTPWPPLYATEQAAWVGTWTGYTKDYSHDTLVPL